MNRARPLPKILIRIVAVVLGIVGLGGCATYHQHSYIDSGGYFSRAGGYSGAAGYSQARYSQARYAPTNPAIYPYYSLDYFYFSRYYHPYSVYVGYREPLYYPYPGWALGYHRSLHSRYSPGYGFGYPWHGFEHRYPRFSLGFFASRGLHPRVPRHGVRRHHPIRQIDQRLGELQQRRVDPPRRTLLTRTDRRLENKRLENRRSADRSSVIRAGNSSRSLPSGVAQRSGRREIARQQLLQGRDSRLQQRREPGSRAASRPVVRQAQRRAEILRDTRRSDSDQQQADRERSARRGIQLDDRRRRVIVDRSGAGTRGGHVRGDATRADDRHVRESTRRAERASGERSIRRQQRDTSAGRVRRAAESAPGASRSRGSLIPRARRAPGRDARTTKPKRQRAAPRSTRGRSLSTEQNSRGTARRSASRDGGRTSSRRDRLRSRSDGRRRR